MIEKPTFEQLPEVMIQLYNKLEKIEQLLEKNTVNESNEDSLLTVKEAADFINLAVPTLYGLVSKKTVPFCKRSKKLYFSKQDLIGWVKEGRKKTISEIEETAISNLTFKKR